MRNCSAYYHPEKNAITDKFDARVHAFFPARRDLDYVVVGAVFLHKAALMGFQSAFSHIFENFNF